MVRELQDNARKHPVKENQGEQLAAGNSPLIYFKVAMCLETQNLGVVTSLLASEYQNMFCIIKDSFSFQGKEITLERFFKKFHKRC